MTTVPLAFPAVPRRLLLEFDHCDVCGKLDDVAHVVGALAASRLLVCGGCLREVQASLPNRRLRVVGAS